MSDTNTNELLEMLGLTEYEAKTLGTLFKLKEAEAPTISRMAQVPKTRVYDVLEKLMKRDLLIEIKGRPKIYRAINPEEAIDKLVKNKKKQLFEMEEKANLLKQDLILHTGKDDAGEKIMKVKDKQDFERILGQEIGKAREQILGLTEIRDEQGIIHDALKKAKDKNVRIKLLNSNPSKKLKEYSETKTINHGLNAFILDDKKIILAISDFKKQKPGYHFTIMNEHTPMAEALKHYFENNWKKAKDN